MTFKPTKYIKDKETLDANIKSRDKWWNIHFKYGVDREGSNCALCRLSAKNKLGCKVCPLYLIGESCYNHSSVYEKWSLHVDEHNFLNNRHRNPYCRECKKLSFNMLKLLDDLLPKKYRRLK